MATWEEIDQNRTIPNSIEIKKKRTLHTAIERTHITLAEDMKHRRLTLTAMIVLTTVLNMFKDVRNPFLTLHLPVDLTTDMVLTKHEQKSLISTMHLNININTNTTTITIIITLTIIITISTIAMIMKTKVLTTVQ